MERAIVYIAAIGWLAAEAFVFPKAIVVGLLVVLVANAIEQFTE